MTNKLLITLFVPFVALAINSSLTTKKIDVILPNTSSNVDVQAPLIADDLTLTTGATVDEISTDTTLAGDSDTAIPTERAVKAYVDASAGGGGDVTGPAGATDNALPRFDTATGKLIQDSGVIVDDSDNMTGVAAFTATGLITGGSLTLTSGATINELSTDGTLVGDSDTAVPTEQAVKTYVDTEVSGISDTTRQQAYVAGPDITLNSTQNGLSIIDAVTPIGVSLFRIVTNALTDIIDVTASGLKLATGARVNEFSTDTSLAGDSDLAIPTERAVKAYVDANAGAGGDVVGPASSTDNAIARFDLATGKLIQNSGVLISDTDIITSSGINVNGRMVVSSTTEASTPCPVMTNVERSLLVPLMGDCVYVSDVPGLFFYNGTAWINQEDGSNPPVIASGFLSIDTYTGTGAAGNNVVLSNPLNLSADGGLVWIKNTGVANDHWLQDDTTGLGFAWTTATDANRVAVTATGFNTNGYTINDTGPRVNTNSDTYLSFSFKETANDYSKFTYTGNGGTQTVAHGCGAAPKVVLYKGHNVSRWAMWFGTASLGGNVGIVLNQTNIRNPGVDWFNNSDPDATNVFVSDVGGANTTNNSGTTYTAHAFCSAKVIVGEVADNFGSVNLGSNIKWIMTKRITGSASDWHIFNDQRWAGVSQASNNLYISPNVSGTETNAGQQVINGSSFDISGFYGAAGDTILYMAIIE